MSTNTAAYMAPAMVPATRLTKTATSTSSVLIASNMSRKTIIVSNPTTGLGGIMAYIGFDNPCTLDDIAVGPGNSVTLYRAPTGTMYCRTETLPCKLNVKEFE